MSIGSSRSTVNPLVLPERLLSKWDYGYNPRKHRKIILINDILCSAYSHSRLIFFDTKSGKEQKKSHGLDDPIQIVKLDNTFFAVVAYGMHHFDTHIQIWQVTNREPKRTTEPVKLSNVGSFPELRVSPDGRYLACIEQKDCEVSLFLFDCLKQRESKQIILFLPPKTAGQIKKFKFTHPQEFVLLVHSWPNDGYHEFGTYFGSIIYKFRLNSIDEPCVQVFKGQLLNGLLLNDLFPSPDGSQWLFETTSVVERRKISFYLLDAESPSSELKKIATGRLEPQWWDDKILFTSRSYYDRTYYIERAELYDCATQQGSFCDFSNIAPLIDLMVTNDNKIFVISRDGRFEYRDLPKNQLTTTLEKYPESKVTPFIETLERTPGTNLLSRQLHVLIQDYTYSPMISMFRPAKHRMPEITIRSLPTLVDNMINALQLKGLEMRKTMPDEKYRDFTATKKYPLFTPYRDFTAQQQHTAQQLSKLHYDLMALNRFKELLPQHWWFFIYSSSEDATLITSSIENIVNEYKGFISYGLLQFFENVNQAIGLAPERIRLLSAKY